MRYKKEQFEGIYGYLKDRVSAGDLPTAVFGITGLDGTVDLRAFGSKPDGSPVRTDDRYLLFSVTKPMMGMALMRLCEKGLLHPGEYVEKYIPGFRANGKEKITIWHLLTHTSGLKQGPLENWQREDPSGSTIVHEALCGYFTGAGLEFEPGTAVKYNNLAYSVIAEIINRVSGTDYETYLQTNLLQPLGMNETGFDPYACPPERSVPTMGAGNQILPTEGFCKAKLPAGGLHSTAPDMLKLGRAVLNEGSLGTTRLISSATHRQMITPQTLDIVSGPDAAVFGLSWRTPVNRRSMICRKVYGHNGMGGCMLWMYPEHELAFVLMTNQVGLEFDLTHIHNVFAGCL